MKTTLSCSIALLVLIILGSCSSDDHQHEQLSKPTMQNIEVGLNNNETGIIGRDFHFNADIIAGEKIEEISVAIFPRTKEEYVGEWSFQIVWNEFKGLRNTTVHKHFDIPKDAVEGVYDFIVSVTDENGSLAVEEREITVFHPENLPVDPEVSNFSISRNFEFFYREGEFSQGNQLKINDSISSQATVSGVKGDGRMYLLLIKKDLEHRPETIADIDFSKAIVYDYYEHTAWTEVDDFSNFVYDLDSFTTVRGIPVFAMGADYDNAPEPNAISGDKQWEAGTYYFGTLYENTTFNRSLFHYIEFDIVFE